MSSRVEKAGSKFRPSLGRKRVSPSGASSATLPPSSARSVSSRLSAASDPAGGLRRKSVPEPGPAVEPITAGASGSRSEDVAPSGSRTESTRHAGPPNPAAQAGLPSPDTSETRPADDATRVDGSPPSPSRPKASVHDLPTCPLSEPHTSDHPPSLPNTTLATAGSSLARPPPSSSWNKAATPTPSPGPTRGRISSSRLSLAQPQALRSLASEQASVRMGPPPVRPHVQTGILPPSSDAATNRSPAPKPPPATTSTTLHSASSAFAPYQRGAHPLQGHECVAEIDVTGSTSSASRENVSIPPHTDGTRDKSDVLRRRQRRLPRTQLPSRDEERSTWQQLESYHNRRVTEHHEARAKRAALRQERRTAGLDAEQTTSESELSEPELTLPPSMQGPESSTSMADLTGMRWTRGRPGPKTFLLDDKLDAWKAKHSQMSAKAQRHLERRIANGDEFRKKDVHSEDSGDDDVPAGPDTEPSAASDAHDSVHGPHTEAERSSPLPDAGAENPVEDEEVFGALSGQEGSVGPPSPTHWDGVPSEQEGSAVGQRKAKGKAKFDSPSDLERKAAPTTRKFRESAGTAQFRIRDDGVIDVDPDSLLFDRNQEAFEQSNSHEVHGEDRDEWTFTNSASYVNTTRRGKSLAVSKDGEAAIPRTRTWSSKETKQLLSAISLWGTDFGMIARAFPHRTRAQIKSKYHKLDMTHPVLLNQVLTQRTPLKRHISRPSSEATQQDDPLKDEPNRTAGQGEPGPLPTTAFGSDDLAAPESSIGASSPAARASQNPDGDPAHEPDQGLATSSTIPKPGVSPFKKPSDPELIQGVPRMSLEDWAHVAQFDLDAPTPEIKLPDHIRAINASEEESFLPGTGATKRSRSEMEGNEWEEEEEVEILPDGTRRVSVRKVCKPHALRRKPKLSISSTWARDRAHRADVMADQAGVAAGEYEEVVGTY